MEFNIYACLYATPFILTGIIATFILFRIWRHTEIFARKWFITLLIASAVWSLAQALEYLCSDLEAKILFDNLQWFGIVMIPPTFLILALEYSDSIRRKKQLVATLLVLVPTLTLLIVFTNNFHHLFADNYVLIEHNGFIGMGKDYFIPFWIFMAYSYVLFLLGLYNLIKLANHPQKYYVSQIKWTIIAAIVTVITSIIDTTSLNPFPFFQSTALAMSSLTLVIVGNMSKLQSMDIKKASRNILLDAISNPLFLFTVNSEILDLNLAAQNLIGKTAAEAIGQPLEQTAPELFNMISPLLDNISNQVQTSTKLSIGQYTYDAELSSNWDDFGRLQSYALLLSTHADTDKTIKELQRSNTLIQALGKVSAAVASVSTPAQVFDTMSKELHKLSLEFTYISFDKQREYSTTKYASFEIGILKPLEKIVGKSFIGFTLHRSDFPPIVEQFENQKPVFTADFIEAIRPALKRFPNDIVKTGLRAVGISKGTSGIFIPINTSDGSFGFLAIWGDSLRQQDLPAFSIFASQISSSIEQAHLKEIEQEQLRESDRANSLIVALNRVAAQTSSFLNSQSVLEILADELKLLNLEFYLCIVDKEHQTAEIRFVSPDITILRQVERIFKGTIIGYKLPRESWPPLAIEALEQKKVVFTQAFAQDAKKLFFQFPDKLAKKGLEMVGIYENTPGIHISEELQDGTTAMLSIWGENIKKSDLPTFSIFASQIAHAFERADMFDTKQKQVQILERSNELVRALAQVAAQASSAYQTDQVLDKLDQELSLLGLNYLLILTDKDRKAAKLQNMTMRGWAFQSLREKIQNKMSDITMTRENWPEIVSKTIDEKKSFYTERLLDLIPPNVYASKKPRISLAMKQLGVNENTTAIIIPQEFTDGRMAILSIWGNNIQPSDLPAFSVFASQITNVFEKSLLFAAEQEHALNLGRSNALVEALSLVAANVASSTSPNVVINSLGTELKKIELDCMIVLIDPETNEGYIRFHTMESKLMKQAEKLTRRTLSEQHLPIAEWPASLKTVFENNQSLFIEDFRELIRSFIGANIPGSMAYKAISAIGIDEKTRGFFLPLAVKGKIFGCLSTWDKSLSQADLPTFTIFANQIAIAFENARLFKAEQNQARELEHANNLLSVLSRIAARVTPTTQQKDIMVTMSDELGTLGFNFVYLDVDQEVVKSKIEYISLDSKLLNQIKKLANVTLEGRTLPSASSAKEAILAVQDNQPTYLSSFTGYIQSIFSYINRSVLDILFESIGFTKDTAGIFLPLFLGDGTTHLLIIWGDSLKRNDLSAFLVYKTQMESIMETARLYNLAQQEISERRTAQEALTISQKELRGLFENAHDAIIISDPITGQVLDVNERAVEIFGYSHDEFTHIQLAATTENTLKLDNTISNILLSEQRYNFEIIQYRKDDHNTPLEMEVNAGIVTYHGKPAIQSIHRDVTRRKKMEAQLRHDSLHDALTHLPNRTFFLAQLNHAIAHNSRNRKYSFAVLYLDLDRFKDINDTLGHLVGDKLLLELAKRLRVCMRTTDTISRIGGDEFAILFEDIQPAHGLTDLCTRLLKTINQPFFIQKNEISISGSIGVVISDVAYTNPEEYLRDADIAMYSAKNQGRARFNIFNVSMRTSVMKRMEIENNLRKAVKNGEFFLVYQPIFNLSDHHLTGLEVLLRWQQPDCGLIPPLEFIPIAENIGIIHTIGHWVLQNACTQMRRWQTKHPEFGNLKLNINVSAIQLLRDDFPNEVKAVIKHSKLDPNCLVLEITETAFINDQEIASRQVEALKAMGIQIHLDDFGTGYSSLSFINLFQVDGLKIERQFINSLDQSKQAELVRAVLALGENIGLEIIAEGIETQAQLDFLKDNGCLQGQGYLYSKPLPTNDVSSFCLSHPKPGQKVEVLSLIQKPSV